MPNKPPISKPWSNPTKHTPKSRSSTQRGYGYRWQKTREGILAKNPLCYICMKLGRVVPGTEVDHIIPHKGNMQIFWDSTNWQVLCKSCHSKKTAKGL